MAPAMATKRLREELIKLKTQPPPGIIAEPDESNILKWFYAIRGPTDTPYEGGVYLGKLVFPKEYPLKPPSIHMLTPSGRFQINTKICMSMSDFHPESWNPMWSVATIIQGVQSFMASDELTTGGMKAPEADRKKFAKLSMAYNQKNYPNLFEGDIEAALEASSLACQKAEEENAKSSSSSAGQKSSSRRSHRMANKTGDNEQEEAEKNTENGNSVKDQKPSLSRRGRRLAKMAASAEQGQSNQDSEIISTNIESKSNSGDNEPDLSPDVANMSITKELTPEEIEKRRRRNAKKRAKQKAKKNASNLVEDT